MSKGFEMQSAKEENLHRTQGVKEILKFISNREP